MMSLQIDNEKGKGVATYATPSAPPATPPSDAHLLHEALQGFVAPRSHPHEETSREESGDRAHERQTQAQKHVHLPATEVAQDHAVRPSQVNASGHGPRWNQACHQSHAVRKRSEPDGQDDDEPDLAHQRHLVPAHPAVLKVSDVIVGTLSACVVLL